MREIQRISVTDAVVDNIRELIDSQKYVAGEKLPTESQFCEMMKVSRTSVREALRVLQTLGYVEIRPGKGAFVANMLQRKQNDNWYDVDNAKFYDFMEVRIAIETLSVRLSVERATEAQVQELEEIHKTFLEAAERQDLIRLIMLDELFHTKIVSYTNNQLLININKQVLECFRVYRSSSFTNKDVYRNAIEPHRLILDCFRRKDSDGAVREMLRHLEITSEDMNQIHRREKGKDTDA